MSEKMLGVMLDCSRNAVMNVPSLKRFIDHLAKMGYNMLQLYTEDTYEIEGEPYFGYLRGRYTVEEMQELDAYAKERGIEMIPCIQTLAHLGCMTRWGGVYGSITDVGDILLADDERTYALIDKMFATMRRAYTTDRIHIGMDEAHMVGLGKYLDRHGYQNRTEILLRHLARVCDIAKKYDFKPMMWSDMFFRLASGGAYFGTGAKFSQEVIDAVPPELSLVYWDYYSQDPAKYEANITSHQQFKNEIIFAGGIWTWRGFAPRNSFSLKACEAAVTACNKKGVNNVFFTMWGDDGGECSYFSVLAPLFYAAEISRGNNDVETIKTRFEDLFGEKWDHVMDLELANSVASRCDVLNGGKYMLYCDPFMGLLDSTVHEGDSDFYAESAKVLHAHAAEGTPLSANYHMQATLCDALTVKCDLGVRTLKAYQAGDKEALAALIPEYTKAYELIEKFYEAYKAVWFRDNKPFGFEIQEMRIGALLLRLTSCRDRLQSYLNGEINVIEELAVEHLPFNGHKEGERLDVQGYSYGSIVTGRISGW